MSQSLVITVAFAYLLLLFAVAYWGDRRAAQGRSVIGSAWVYVLSISVYCTAWTYFGSVGRAAGAGMWFLPIYLGPTLAMILAWLVVRKMIRIAKTYRITSIADFISSRYGKSPVLAGAVTLVTVVGIVPYIALQLKAIALSYSVLTTPLGQPFDTSRAWWEESTFYLALGLAGFTMVFGTRQLDAAERHEGMVVAIALESLVKLVAFLAIGVFVTYVVFDGVEDIFGRVRAAPELAPLLTMGQGDPFPYTEWFGTTLLAMLAVIMLPRQFQMMVVENVDEGHLRRAAWMFPLYLLLINLFVLPIAFAGLLDFGRSWVDPETYVLSLPLAYSQDALALLGFVGGLSAATGMVIVESIAVSTMVCNDLVMPVLLRTQKWLHKEGPDLTRLLLLIRRLAILLLLMLGYLYYHLAVELYALASIGLISFAAVAQFGPALLGGLYWKGGTRQGATIGLLLGFAVWVYTLLLPSLARTGWFGVDFLQEGPWGIGLLVPEELFGLDGLDHLTHSLFWSLLFNTGAYVLVSVWRGPSVREATQAVLFVDVFERTSNVSPIFWRGQASVAALRPLAARFLGAERVQQMLEGYARERGLEVEQLKGTPELVQFVETQLAGAIGGASARVMVASVVQEEPLEFRDVISILEEANRLRLHSRELEEKSLSLERATAELRAANEQLQSLDRMKDDFMSSVTHELRTPLTSIRALAELMLDDAGMALEQREQFLNIVVSETERLTRLVNQVLDLAKIESGHADWRSTELDIVALVRQSLQTTAEMLRERGIRVRISTPDVPVMVRADADRLTQVMLNLLSNAAKFVPRDTGEIHVRVVAASHGVTVEVEDNGPGVALELQRQVFEKFRQGGDGLDRPQGTGLGLPISRQIVEHFGGRMWLRSEPGQGACFGFLLPVLTAAVEPPPTPGVNT